KDAGGSNRQVAAEVGVSEGSVRRAMRLHSKQAEPQPEIDQQQQQQQAVVDEASEVIEVADDDQIAGAEQQELAVLGAQESRTVERRLSRGGVLGVAATVFTGAARRPVGVLFATLPGLEAT